MYLDCHFPGRKHGASCASISPERSWHPSGQKKSPVGFRSANFEIASLRNCQCEQLQFKNLGNSALDITFLSWCHLHSFSSWKGRGKLCLLIRKPEVPTMKGAQGKVWKYYYAFYKNQPRCYWLFTEQIPRA